MVNGKPNLTFGDNQYTMNSRVQPQRGNKARNSNKVAGFDSYLPVADYASAKGVQKNGGQAQANAGVRQNQRQAVAQPLNAGARGAQKSGAAFAPSALAGYPDISYPGVARASGQAGITAEAQRGRSQPRPHSLPLGGNSRSEARATAQAGMEEWSGNMNLGSQSRRFSQKTSPRISNQPITGRQAFGMEDTRKNRRTSQRQGNPLQAARGGQGRPLGAERRGANTYGSYAGAVPGGQGSQSFVANGFGGGNAETALRGLGYTLNERQPDTTYARRLDSDTGVAVNKAGLVFGSGRPVAFPNGEDGARTSVMTASHRKKPDAHIAAAYPGRSMVPSFYSMADLGVGSLAAKFESGSEGIAAIGYDRKGGTSYGKYQISSRAGTMGAFINYLDEKAPELAKRLRAAGPANTGARSGKMPNEWKKIAAEDPARFEKLQGDFIRTSHFEPAMQSIAQSTGLGFNDMPAALQEVLFSTAVQHGPFGAVRIFNQALNNVGVNKLQATGKNVTESFKRAGRQLIKQVYALRAGQFMSSTAGVRAAVRNRLSQEMNEALQMLA